MSAANTALTAQPGQLVAVVGPSGAGKDAVLHWLTTHWSGPVPLYRVRRTITRAPEPEGEAHEAVDLAAFEHLLAQGAFAWHWSAHGLCYGVRRSELSGLNTGALVLINGSRAHLAEAFAQFADMAVLHITASEDTLRERLLARQRESLPEVLARVARSKQLPPISHPKSLTVHNDGRLDDAGHQARDWLLQLVAESPPPVR